jgi:hypothetical protein
MGMVEMNRDNSLIFRFSRLRFIALPLFLLIVLIFVISGAFLQMYHPIKVRQTTDKTSETTTIDYHEPETRQASSVLFENDFYAGCACMANGEIQKAREYFTKYLKANRLRIDSDMDIANLIGLGLACESLEDYRFSGGYFFLATKVCFQRRFMLTPSESCNYFRGQFYGFSRLEPFMGLMRLAIQEQDLSGGFFWSEYIHALKIMDKMDCQDQKAKPFVTKGFCEEKMIIKESIHSVFNQMKYALDFNDRIHFLELTSNLNRLRKEYHDYDSDLHISPLNARQIPLEPGEAFLEYQVTEQKTFAWLVQNQKIKINVIIPISRTDLETQIKNYTGTATSRHVPGKMANYDPNLGADLYDLLMK